MIDSNGLKVFGEGERKVKKHGKARRRIWLLMEKYMKSSATDLSLNNVTDAEAFPGLSGKPRKTSSAAANGAYDTRLCLDELRRKKITALISPRKGAGY